MEQKQTLPTSMAELKAMTAEAVKAMDRAAAPVDFPSRIDLHFPHGVERLETEKLYVSSATGVYKTAEGNRYNISLSEALRGKFRRQERLKKVQK